MASYDHNTFAGMKLLLSLNQQHESTKNIQT